MALKLSNDAPLITTGFLNINYIESILTYLNQNEINDAPTLKHHKLNWIDKYKHSEEIDSNTAKHRGWYGNIHELLKDIPHVFIKGYVSDTLFCGNKGYRKSKDIDILIPRRFLGHAKNCFIKQGFTRGYFSGSRKEFVSMSRIDEIQSEMYSHETIPLSKLSGILVPKYISVDINFMFSWNGFMQNQLTLMRLVDESICKCKELSIEGTLLPVLSNEYMLIHLVLHFYHEATHFILSDLWDNSPHEIELNQLYEIRCLFDNVNFDLMNSIILNDFGIIEGFDFTLSLLDTLGIPVQKYTNFTKRCTDYFFDKKGIKCIWRSHLKKRLSAKFDRKREASYITSAKN